MSDRLSLEFLIKLIPEKFDGDRYKLRSFIKQVDSVFEIAQPNQKKALLLFVKSKIIGKAREQIDVHCSLTTWEEISELLLNLYQDKKSLDQLLEELNNIRQSRNEDVSHFYQRLEDLTSRILAVIHTQDGNKASLTGRVSMITDMTLNRFVYHSHPQISQMLRYREFRTINEAFTAAAAEEKALRLRFEKPSVQKCQICHKSNHATRDCFRNKPNNIQQTRTQTVNFANTQKESVNSTPIKQCRYCKKFGHTIEECRKRQYVNNRKQN